MASKSDTWMPFYVADYLRDTMHLSTEQHGAYLLLLMACWAGGGSLPDNPAMLAGIAKLSPAAWRRNAQTLTAFFQREDGILIHKRVKAEAEKAKRLSDIRRQMGAKGGRPPKPTGGKTQTKQKPIGLANDKQNGSQTETPSPRIRIDPQGSNSNPTRTCDDARHEGASPPVLTVVEKEPIEVRQAAVAGVRNGLPAIVREPPSETPAQMAERLRKATA